MFLSFGHSDFKFVSDFVLRASNLMKRWFSQNKFKYCEYFQIGEYKPCTKAEICARGLR